ncbi:uncharacterized protein RJT21DRAFT_12556 [Scheffersomyces amazonensis]|uniref:uncharacterized protein n=1 Tax=Scheffersomyces amazonensis TaxID=1078765 RepID=UPI00315C7C7D
MVDITLLSAHYDNREELLKILEDDHKRKESIKLAVLQIMLNGGKKDVSANEDLSKKIDQYEVTINKLKQDHSTKVKLMEARLEAVTTENMRYRDRMKAIDQSSSKGHQVSNLNTINRPKNVSNNVLSPMGRHINPKRKYLTASIISVLRQQSMILDDPPPHSKAHKIESLPSETDSQTQIDSSSQPNSQINSQPDIPNQNSSQTDPESHPEPVLRTPSAKAFVKGFDLSSTSDSDSGDVTPSKRKNSNISLSGDDTTTKSADNTFTSANSSVGGTQSDDENKKKSKKKLQLWKSEITRPNEKRSHSLGLEDENVNSLNYYEDNNFLGDDSPAKNTQKRPVASNNNDETTNKRKKNIFTIS